MEIIYIITVILTALFLSFENISFKNIKLNAFIITLINSIICFIIFSIIIYFLYTKYPDKFERIKNPYGIKKNPLKNIFNYKILQIGLVSQIYFIIFVYLLTISPISLIITMSPLWIIFSLILNKLMNNIEITLPKVFGVLIVLFGIIYSNWDKLFVNNTNNNTNIILIILLIIFGILKGYTINIVKEIEKYVQPIEIGFYDYSISIIVSIIVYIIYLLNPLKKWKPEKFKTNNIITILFITLFTTVPYVIFKFISIKNIPEYFYTVLINLSIIFNLILSKIVFKETIKMQQIIGAIIIIIGISFVPILNFLNKKFKM
jgi:drug/metabolite transporter (DMT)-like permease